MQSAPESTYAERLAYARWVRDLTTPVRDESDQALIDRAGVKQSWFSRWRNSDTPPPRHVELLPLAKALGVTMDFLLGQGDPPLPALWRDWLSARRGTPVQVSDPRYVTEAEPIYPDPALDERVPDEEVRAAQREVAARKQTAQRQVGNDRRNRR